MLNKRTLITTLGAAVLATTAAASPGEYDRDDYYERRGPMPFEVLDLDGDGTVTAQEHAQVRAERHARRAEYGYPMRGMADAPDFAQIDRDGSGAISPEELSAWQAQRMQQRQAQRWGQRSW